MRYSAGSSDNGGAGSGHTGGQTEGTPKKPVAFGSADHLFCRGGTGAGEFHAYYFDLKTEGSTDSTTVQGDGSENNPFVIKTETQLTAKLGNGECAAYTMQSQRIPLQKKLLTYAQRTVRI